MGEGGQACELAVDGLGEREGGEGGPEVREVGHSHGNRLGASLDARERGLGAIVDTADPGPHPGFADELHGRQEQVLSGGPMELDRERGFLSEALRGSRYAASRWGSRAK